MATLALKLNTSNVDKAIEQLKARAPQAIARAMNRSIVSARTVMVKHIAADTGLKSAVVKEQIVTREARPDKLTASIEMRGKRIPLIDFRAKGPEPSRGRGRGVTARLPGGAGRYPHAFIATTRSGHRGVFERYDSGGRTGARGPRGGRVYQLHGPSFPHVFQKFLPEGLARGHEALVANVQHELRFALKQSGG